MIYKKWPWREGEFLLSGIHGRVTNKPENKLLEDINPRNKGPPMSLLTKMKYSFVSRGINTETFTVVSFKGYEAISRPYAFEIILASDHRDIDPLRVLRNPGHAGTCEHFQPDHHVCGQRLSAGANPSAGPAASPGSLAA
ncbi:MAG: hypothetical protein M0T82_02290 [Desulfobacteraceae bacterium]|nr:hypothetical protein [Desulfobacteraceae bacterium]